MTCHNGSPLNDYAGSGLENPHPFTGGSNLRCTDCHGGNPQGSDEFSSHVPPPPEIGDDAFQALNNAAGRTAYFNRLTLTGMDRYADYTVNGVTYTALDYLQFVNPGDLRVTEDGRSCGQCHSDHSESVAGSMLATSSGVLGGATYAIGAENKVPANVGLYGDTAGDVAFRAVTDQAFGGTGDTGAVSSLIEQPVYSVRGQTGGDNIHGNAAYNAADLANDRNADNSVVNNSHLENLYEEQVSFTCGDCHLGSAGANNRYGDFRSSGCTACHMRYSLSGRSTTGDPNVNSFEPIDVDQIDAPERSHPKRHLIQSVAKTLTTGEFVQGIDDYSCAGCHQGSNRTVMQFWGIRLDQNEDVRRGVQYPANPVSYTTTQNDTRLFDPVINNETFNGRRHRQYLLEEDYDNDGRDDTPPDVHYEAGMGCIDCHGTSDLHGGNPATQASADLKSRMEQAVAIECESCHGGVSSYALTTSGTAHDGTTQLIGMDRKGNQLPHVVREGNDFFLYSRLTGVRHYISQTRDTVVDSGKMNPLTTPPRPVYSDAASFAMGRDDGSAATGHGPQQSGTAAGGFAHSDSMSCASCHSSWTNTCIGCHLGGEYDANGFQFSNITGERIVFDQANADFVYQTPVLFQLGIGSRNLIDPITPNTETFFQYRDLNGTDSQIFTFSDRNGGGSNPSANHPSLSHNVMMPHSIRGRVNAQNEGVRNCVACHLNDESLANFGTEYNTMRAALATGTPASLANLDFPLLQSHIGLNTGNQLNSPLWVHMVAGLGTGLFLFDQNGGAVNPLDDDANRVGSGGTSPKDQFDLNNVFFDLDRLVESNGVSNGSSNHPMDNPGGAPFNRDGAADQELSGPLGTTLIQRLTDPATGIVLDSWFDANGTPQGDASLVVGGP